MSEANSAREGSVLVGSTPSRRFAYLGWGEGVEAVAGQGAIGVHMKKRCGSSPLLRYRGTMRGSSNPNY